MNCNSLLELEKDCGTRLLRIKICLKKTAPNFSSNYKTEEAYLD